MLNYVHRCKECDCVLWSMVSKAEGLCHECAMPDEEPATCLEELLACAGEGED